MTLFVAGLLGIAVGTFVGCVIVAIGALVRAALGMNRWDR